METKATAAGGKENARVVCQAVTRREQARPAGLSAKFERMALAG